jgi:aminoglycoside phosphotransferase (APT) family kinase protein
VVEALADPAMPVLEEFWSCPGEPELLSGLLEQGSALAAAISAPTPCLLHGDCHLGNLLREDGRLVWIDWQATGTGSPALDLAFCCARAVPEADPPVRELVHAYAATRHVDETRLASAVLAAELVIRLASWPHFARCNTPAAVGRVHRRVHLLARAWHEA